MGTSAGSAGSGRPAPASRPFHKQETVPGAAVSNGPPHLKSWGQGLLPSGTHPGLREERIPGSRGLRTIRGMGKESLATEQRTGGRRLPKAPPQARLRPLAGQPPSLSQAHRLRLLGTKPECRRPRFQKAGVARLSLPGSGGVRGQKIQPVQCPDNTCIPC